MSNIDKQALRERYSAKPTPKCDICGAQMTIQRMSGSRVTYGCSGAIYDGTGCHYAEGRSLADDHYEQSRVTVTDESDPDVLALLDELEAKKRISSTWRKTAESNREKLEAAEKRIAELEALGRGVKQFSEFQICHYGATEDYAKGYIDCQNNYNKVLFASAGKGE